MAGSWGHIADEEDGGRFRLDLIENLGDAAEALEECYGMIQWLARSTYQVTGRNSADLIADAQAHYREGLALGGAATGRDVFGRELPGG